MVVSTLYPTTKMSLVAYGESSGSEDEGTVGSSSKGDEAQGVRRLLSVLPAPGKGRNQPVRLAIPSLGQSKGVSACV